VIYVKLYAGVERDGRRVENEVVMISGEALSFIKILEESGNERRANKGCCCAILIQSNRTVPTHTTARERMAETTPLANNTSW
jgi:hypothetical protein